MVDITVSVGTDADIAAAMMVWAAANEPDLALNPLRDVYQAKAEGYLREPRGFFVVGRMDSTIVSMAEAMPARYSGGRGRAIPHTCQTGMLCVSPAIRGGGVGRLTYTALLAEARSRGFTQARVWARVGNAPAARLYESCGFRRTGRRRQDPLRGVIEEFHCADVGAAP